MIAAVILMFYLSIALLDSLHFKLAIPAETNTAQASASKQFSAQTTSVLDLIFAQIQQQTERTYAAPFALQEYSRSIVKNSAGEVEQVYLPLKHAGQHLANPSDKLSDILLKTLQALISSLVVSLLLIVAHIFWRASAQKLSFSQQAGLVLTDKTNLPWRAGYLTFAISFSLIAVVFYLGHFYPVFGTDKVGA